MSSKILVVGHRNPDNDSICSAVGYAHLKNELARRNDEDTVYVPARLGQLPRESAWVLEDSGIPAPEAIAHVHARVSDVMTPDPVSISHNATMLEAGRLLRKHNIRSLVVEGDDGTFLGLIATRAVAERYISATDELEEGQPASTMAVATSLIESLGQRVSELMSTNVLVLEKEGLLKEAVEDLLASELREGVVLDEDGRAIGIVTRSDIAVRPKRKVILVDHNEMRQAAPGIEEADVVEIIDHHRIADISTANPIRFLNYPIGSTATIVTMSFRNNGVEVTPSIAAVLLSAIMTDTVILKSPTTTQVDREQAQYLADILDVSPTDFGIRVFKTRGDEGNTPIKDLVEADSKEFVHGDDTLLIAQHETVDLKAVMAREEEIRAYVRTLKESRGYDLVLLMVTDIVAEGSQFIAEGNLRLVNKTFGINCTGEGGTWMPGVLSRKKQVAAKLLGQ